MSYDTEILWEFPVSAGPESPQTHGKPAAGLFERLLDKRLQSSHAEGAVVNVGTSKSDKKSLLEQLGLLVLVIGLPSLLAMLWTMNTSVAETKTKIDGVTISLTRLETGQKELSGNIDDVKALIHELHPRALSRNSTGALH